MSHTLDHVAGAYGAGVTIGSLAGPANVGPLLQLTNDSGEVVQFGPHSPARLADVVTAWARAHGVPRGWCVWSPTSRAWYASPPVAPITYTEDSAAAFVFTSDQAVRLWVSSGFTAVPMPVDAAGELMAQLESYAIGLGDAGVDSLVAVARRRLLGGGE